MVASVPPVSFHRMWHECGRRVIGATKNINASHFNRRKRLLYVASQCPVLSETFVYREIQELRATGCLVDFATLRTPVDNPMTREVSLELGPSIPIYGLGKWALLRDATIEMVSHPLQTVRTLSLVVRDALLSTDCTLRGRVVLLVQIVAALALAHRARSRHCDYHLHSHMANAPTTIAMYTASQLKTTFSFTGHANGIFSSREFLAEKLTRCAFVACISHWHREFYRQVKEISDNRSPLVRCGVDIPTSPHRHHEGDGVRFVSVGRLVAKKGFDVIIDAAAILRDRGLPFDITIVGDGPARGMLVEQIAALRLTGFVSLVGAKPHGEVLRILSNSSICVLACKVDAKGDRDGIPVVLMEAMAAGVAVIAGEVSAIHELVQQDRTGLLTRPNDPRDLADAMERLAREPSMRLRLGLSGRKYVSEEFSTRVNIHRLITAFHGVDPELARDFNVTPAAAR